jgi:UDP-N-acetylglucosamine acyltransferase
MIHPTVIIDKTANIDPSVNIGPYAIIGESVSIGKNTTIGAYSYIEFSNIGTDCKISNNVCIGTPPQDFKYKDKKTNVIMGNNVTIREFATVHRASLLDSTKIGDNCYLMAYSHAGHDCILGKEVVLANCASLGGHVQIDDWAVIGGLVAIHQFCKVGKLCMLGGGTIATMDVPPYTLSCGDRVKLYGLNLVGIKRRNFSHSTVEKLKNAYRILFMSKMPLTEAVNYLESINSEKSKFDPEVDNMIKFIRSSKRGICAPQR